MDRWLRKRAASEPRCRWICWIKRSEQAHTSPERER